MKDYLIGIIFIQIKFEIILEKMWHFTLHSWNIIPKHLSPQRFWVSRGRERFIDRCFRSIQVYWLVFGRVRISSNIHFSAFSMSSGGLCL